MKLIYVSGTFSSSELVQGEHGGSCTTIGSVVAGTIVQMDDTSPSIFMKGVQENDYLSYHEEMFLYGVKEKQVIVQTAAGSPLIKAPDSAGDVFDRSIVGSVLFIEEGSDAGGYRVVQWVDSRTLLLDKPLTTTTLPIVLDGNGASSADLLNILQLTAGSGSPFNSSHVGAWISIYGIDYRWIGTYPIILASGATLSAQLPASNHGFRAFTGIRWAITAAPTDATAPGVFSRGPQDPYFSSLYPGTRCYAGVPIRVYSAVPKETVISGVNPSTTDSEVTVATAVADGVGVPYRVYRPNIRRVTPSEMNANKAGFLYYFDTDVVSLSPSTSANIGTQSYLTVDSDTYSSIGYRHVVMDPTLSYSVNETGYLDLPLNVLPVGAVDSKDNLVRVVGSPVQVSYERADIVGMVQNFVDSASDRLIAANILVRHFLPAYLSYDAFYQGGSDPSVIVKDIRAYLDQIPIETAVDVSELERLINNRGGNPDTPTTLSATIYDWDRKMWVEFSSNALGGASSTDTLVPYNGSPRVAFFIPGPDVSGQDPLPAGERINLTRR
jgi:hypothetical protein